MPEISSPTFSSKSITNNLTSDAISHVIDDLKYTLSIACSKHQIDLVAFSGGLDSSIVAWYATQQQSKQVSAITVVANDFVSPDLVYSQIASNNLGISPVILNVSIDDILDGTKETIKILRNFNEIEIRNSVVIYLAAKWASENGYTSMATGDGADELFAGYKFLIQTPLDKLSDEIQRVCDSMHFPSHVICKSFGIEPISPFLDSDVLELAKKIAPELKVKYNQINFFNDRASDRCAEEIDSVGVDDISGNGGDNGGGDGIDNDDDHNNDHNNDHNTNIRYGKWILRKSFEDVLDNKIAWRPKYAMQDGSGTVGLTDMFNSIMRIDEESYVEKILKIKDNDGVVIRNRESLYYYEIFRDLYGIPAKFDFEGIDSYSDACNDACNDVSDSTQGVLYDNNNNNNYNDDDGDGDDIHNTTKTNKTKTAHRLCPFCKIKIPDNVRFCRMCAAFPI